MLYGLFINEIKNAIEIAVKKSNRIISLSAIIFKSIIKTALTIEILNEAKTIYIPSIKIRTKSTLFPKLKRVVSFLKIM